MAVSNASQTILSTMLGTGSAVELCNRLNGTIPDALTLGPTTFSSSVIRAAQTFKCAAHSKVGTSAGWVVGAANNLGTLATMAASQTGGTLVVRVDGLHVGDTITGYSHYSSINSAGGAVTLDCQLRKLVIAAGATATDSQISAATQVSVTAATASSSTTSALTEVAAAGTTYYFLFTATTAASTTIELLAPEITVTQA